MGAFLDLNDGSLGFFSGGTGMNEDGHLFSQVGGNAALDLNTGELHLVSMSGDDGYNAWDPGVDDDDDDDPNRHGFLWSMFFG